MLPIRYIHSSTPPTARTPANVRTVPGGTHSKAPPLEVGSRLPCWAANDDADLKARETLMHKTFIATLSIAALIASNSNALAGGSLPVVTHAASKPGRPPLVSLRPGHRGPLLPRDVAQDAGLTVIANYFTQYPNSPYWGWYGYEVF